jgi:hypothetical protein
VAEENKYIGTTTQLHQVQTIEQTKEIIGVFAASATNYIVYYGKPLIAISHTEFGI